MTPGVERLRAWAVGLGAAGLVAAAAGAWVAPDRFFRAYLFAYMFWLGIALGCLGILMLQHVTGGVWGLMVRRLLEAGALTIPFMAVLFIPLAAGIRTLYPWADPALVAHDEVLLHKAPYLNVPFFLVRALLYFAVWSTFAWLLSRWSRRQDETGDASLIRRFQMLSAGGLVIYVVVITLAATDWVMSLQPHWFSTIFGVLLMAGEAVAAFCFVILMAVLLSKVKPLDGIMTPGRVADLGTMLFTFVMVWAYFSFSQYLIIWSGNLPEEIPWYLKRLKGGWEWVGLALIAVHFALPFLLLLMRRVKENTRRLVAVAIMLFVMRIVDTYWMMGPADGVETLSVGWIDVATTVGLGGLWVYLYLRQIRGVSLLPMRDPYLLEALSDDHD